MPEQGESREQRAARYRKLAEENERLAAKRQTEPARKEYLKLAMAWRVLADETDPPK